jgi:membrane protein
MFAFFRRLTDNKKLSLRALLFQTIDHVLDEHSFFTRASAIAFSAMMAFVPFLMLTMTVAVRLLPDLTKSGSGGGIISANDLAQTLQQLFPHDMASVILEQIARLQQLPSLPVLSLSIGLSLWTSSSLFMEIIVALNKIYAVKEKRAWWHLRFTAAALVMLQCLLVFGSLLVIIFWPQIIQHLGLSGMQSTAVTLLKWALLFCVILLSFALTFHFGPAEVKSHKLVSPGAVFGTLAFLAASYGFRVYVQSYANYTTAYGPLGGVMMLMLWFYISSLVLLMAAEMNRLAQIATTKQ